MLGLIAVGALVVYGVYFFALIKLIPITLTLPGIAGLILTIGVAADANIVIFERVKEEIRAGRSVTAGIAQGYKKGIAAIIDANVVTFMTAFILFILATAGVKGFAFVLGIGTLASLFTAVLATQAVLGSMGRSRMISHPTLLGAGKARAPDRVRLHGRVALVLLDVGPDPADRRTGHRRQGAELRHRLQVGHEDHRVDDQADRRVRRARVLTPLGLGDAKIQRVSGSGVSPNAFQITTKALTEQKLPQVKDALGKQFGFTKESGPDRRTRRSARPWPTARSSPSSPRCW